MGGMTEDVKIKQLQTEISMLRDVARKFEIRAELCDTYERWLLDIGKVIGCDHLDNRLPSCIAQEFERLTVNFKGIDNMSTPSIAERLQSLRAMVRYGIDNGKKNMIVDLDLLAAVIGDGNQELTIDELTDRFYLLKDRHIKLLTQFTKIKHKLDAVQCYCPVHVQDEIRTLVADATAIAAGEQLPQG